MESKYIFNNYRTSGSRKYPTQTDIRWSRINIKTPLCTPKDILAKQQVVEQLAVGDYLVFNHAGAYAWNISHQNFLMHDKPKMVFFKT